MQKKWQLPEGIYVYSYRGNGVKSIVELKKYDEGTRIIFSSGDVGVKVSDLPQYSTLTPATLNDIKELYRQ